MLKAEFDMPKLVGSLKRAAKNFGDTNRTAIARWGVQTCRELAVSTQVYGKGGARKKQVEAIAAGVRSTVREVSNKQFQQLRSGRGSLRVKGRNTAIEPDRLLSTADEVVAWVDRHRGGAKGHAERLPADKIGIAPKSAVTGAIRKRAARAGMAKGAWLGAGIDIARRQKGGNRLTIGRNFLGYAQKHAGRGSARAGGTPFQPIAFLRNASAHSASSYVLKDAEKKKALGFGLRKTITWYRRAAKQAIEKK